MAGDCGTIGGSHSHEYHYISATGEDTLLVCESCGDSKNAELVLSEEGDYCKKCGSLLKRITGIEVRLFVVEYMIDSS